MTTARSIELEFFRMLNRIVEPRVRAGLGSPRIAPGGLIVLEHRGRKSGRLVRTPLAATRLQGHVFVATFRAERSQWVKNLAVSPEVRFWLAGRARDARAFVIAPGKRGRRPRNLPALVGWVVSFLRPYTYAGWAFAVLVPQKERKTAARKKSAPKKRKTAAKKRRARA